MLFALLVFGATCMLSLALKKTQTMVLPRADYEKKWDRIDPVRRSNWMILGLDEHKWHNRGGKRDPTGNSKYFKMEWHKLPPLEKNAARELGFDWGSWTAGAASEIGREGHEGDSLFDDLPGHFRGIHFNGDTQYPTQRGQPLVIILTVAELTTAFWFWFSIISIIFMVQYYATPKILMFCLVITTAVVFVLSGALPRRKFALPLDPKGRWILRMTMVFGVLGAIAGFSLSSDNLRDYWPYYSMRHYTNVAPDEPAAAHLDAAVIVFMEGSRPDVNRAIGYHRQGRTYCVAPVGLDSTHGGDDGSASSDIQYWAVGFDCCHEQQGFSCGDSAKSKARSGIVSMKQRTREQSFFQGNLLTDASYFEEAVKMNMAKFDLTSPDDHIIVHWVGDVEVAIEQIFKDALASWFYYELYGFCAAFIAGLVLPLLVFRDEYAIHANATKAKVFKALNYPTYEVASAFND